MRVSSPSGRATSLHSSRRWVASQGDPATQRRGKGQTQLRTSMSKGREGILECSEKGELQHPAERCGAVGVERDIRDKIG